MHVPKSLRLKDPELVDRWSKLVEHARSLPPVPQKVAYPTSLVDWELMAQRDSSYQELVWFHRVECEDVEAVTNLSGDDEADLIMTDYKVHLQGPFIMRHVTVNRMKGEGLNVVKEPLFTRLKHLAKHLWIAASTDLLVPSASELDELLNVLAHAEPTVLPLGDR